MRKRDKYLSTLPDKQKIEAIEKVRAEKNPHKTRTVFESFERVFRPKKRPDQSPYLCRDLPAQRLCENRFPRAAQLTPIQCIYMKPGDWERMSQTHENLGWCKEAPKVDEAYRRMGQTERENPAPKHLLLNPPFALPNPVLCNLANDFISLWPVLRTNCFTNPKDKP